jgi:16S rRNA (uracil1498-N3)-methyltransferase
VRIFISPLAQGDLVVHGDEHHYLSRVRRARVGDEIEILDGEGKRARAVITTMRENETALSVGAVQEISDAPPRVRVLIPWIKGDRMDVCLEKLVEVGADEIIVWPAARAVVKLDGERRVARIAHHQAALQAAARQCGRAAVPTIAAADSLGAAIAAVPNSGARFVLDPLADRAAFAATGDDVTFVSGPEGGLAPAELDALAAAGFIGVGLGPRVLRAETAPVIAVALIRGATSS